MARTGNKKKRVEELFTFRDIDLIEGIANLVMQDRFSVRDALKYLGNKRYDLVNGFSLVPFDDKFLNIMIGYLSEQRNTITRFTLGGHIEFTLAELAEKFGAYHMAYNSRDEMTVFYFKELAKEINAVELQFSHYDLIYDKSTEEVYQLENQRRNLLAPKDIRFNHFTLLF